MDNQTPEERKVRLKKVDSIRRMLAGQSAAGVNRTSGLKKISNIYIKDINMLLIKFM
jgi:hypothetical protein